MVENNRIVVEVLENNRIVVVVKVVETMELSWWWRWWKTIELCWWRWWKTIELWCSW